MDALTSALRQRRAELGHTHKEAAWDVDVSPRQWRRWLSGESCPRDSVAGDLARYLGVSIQEVLDLIDARKDAVGQNGPKLVTSG